MFYNYTIIPIGLNEGRRYFYPAIFLDFLAIPLLWLAFGLATLWLPKRFYVVLPLSAARFP